MKNNFIFFLLFFHDSCHLLTIYTNEEVVSAVSQSSASIEISTKKVMESSMKLLKVISCLIVFFFFMKNIEVLEFLNYFLPSEENSEVFISLKDVCTIEKKEEILNGLIESSSQIADGFKYDYKNVIINDKTLTKGELKEDNSRFTK